MNIKDVEKATGISKQNIRFYEKSGLLHPQRNEENGYREYTDEEIRILKLVKMLRMLDMPIEQIKLVLVCPQQMPHLLEQQTRLLEEKHVAIIPGDAFGASGEGYCRVSYAYSVEHLTEALKRIRNFLGRRKLLK
mgnify:CR=1 FL=1